MKRNLYGTMFNGAVLLVSTAMISACAQTGMQPVTQCRSYDESKDVDVTIKFDGKCPTSVDCEYFDVSKTRFINWKSSDGNGDSPEFKIYFDPFKGRPIASSHGKKKSPPFDPDTPVNVDYKYTIVGTAPDCANVALVDPRFRLC